MLVLLLVLTIKEVMGLYATKHLSVPFFLFLFFVVVVFRWLYLFFYIILGQPNKPILNIEIPD